MTLKVRDNWGRRHTTKDISGGTGHGHGRPPREVMAEKTGFPVEAFDKFGQVIPAYRAQYEEWILKEQSK